jgi:hypothetical protein
MNLPISKSKLIAIISIFLVLGIAGSFLTYGILFPSKDVLPNTSVTGDRLLQDKKVIDIHYVIEENNLSFVHNMIIIHLTSDELKEFPDLERAMHGENDNPVFQRYGTWVVSDFDGNMSDYLRFHNLPCKNKTLLECYPNPPLYEYHGQYYVIHAESIGSHTLAGCERGNYNCTG